MQCFIYKSLKKEFLYLYIVHKDDFSAVPHDVLHHFGQAEFVLELDLTAQRKLAREDSTKVIAQLQENGFFIQMPPSADDPLYAI